MAAFMEMAATNDFSRLDKNAAKRHHFLPQFVLRSFGHSHRGKDFIFQMETQTRRAPARLEIRTAASRHRLYATPDENGNLSNRNEGYLALVESEAARREDGALMEPSDRNRWQPVASANVERTARTSRNRCRQLRPVAAEP
jgi:hypothetical protein